MFGRELCIFCTSVWSRHTASPSVKLFANKLFIDRETGYDCLLDTMLPPSKIEAE